MFQLRTPVTVMLVPGFKEALPERRKISKYHRIKQPQNEKEEALTHPKDERLQNLEDKLDLLLSGASM